MINKDNVNHFSCGWMILVFALLLTSVAIFAEFLFGQKVLLFTDIGSDTYYSYYPYYHLIADYIKSGQFSWWSFKLGSGGGIIGLFQMLYDPFAWIYFLLGPENIPVLVVYVYILKIVVSGLFAYLYFGVIGIDPVARVLCAFLFAFNGYTMVWGQHFYFASWSIFLPAFLYAIEVFLRKRKYGVILLVTAVSALNIALFYQLAIFVSLYIGFRFAWQVSAESRNIEVLGKYAQLCLLILLGAALSAMLWLPEYALLAASPRISVGFVEQLMKFFREFFQLNTESYYTTQIFRLFSNNLQGVGSQYSGFLNYYESNQIFGGILPLLLIPQIYFFSNIKEKLFLSIGLVVAVAYVAFPSLAFLMNGMQYPSYRWGYGISFFNIAISFIVLSRMRHGRGININLLMFTSVALCALLLMASIWAKCGDKICAATNIKDVLTIFSLVGAHVAALAWWSYGAKPKHAVTLLLAVLMLAMVIEHRPSFQDRSVMHKGFSQSGESHYFDGATDAVKWLKKKDHGFYRLDKDHWILSLNDSAIQGYFGLDSYNSLNSPSYLAFTKQFDLAKSMNVIQWSSIKNSYLADIMSVKYHLTKNDARKEQGYFLEKFGDVSVYERKSVLPFGFTYSKYLPWSEYVKLDAATKERVLLHAAVLEDGASVPGMAKLSLEDLVLPDTQARDDRTKYNFSISQFAEDNISGRIDLLEKRIVFFSIPFDDGWSVFVNGAPVNVRRTNIGFMGVALEEGSSEIELKYFPPRMKQGKYITLMAILIIAILFIVGFLKKNTKAK